MSSAMPKHSTASKKGGANRVGSANALEKVPSRATQTTPRWDLLTDPNEPLAVDVEGQTYKHPTWDKWRDRIGRVSVVNTKGQVIYDTYVRYKFEQDIEVRLPPKFLGIDLTWADLKISNGSAWSQEVEKNLAKIFENRVIVGHDLRLEKKAISQETWDKAGGSDDTQNYYGRVGLEKLVAQYLDNDFQAKFRKHDPTHDAMATMLLYLRVKVHTTSHKTPDTTAPVKSQEAAEWEQSKDDNIRW